MRIELEMKNGHKKKDEIPHGSNIYSLCKATVGQTGFCSKRNCAAYAF